LKIKELEERNRQKTKEGQRLKIYVKI